MTRLAGRIAIVTGAAQGIGAAFARALAAEGAAIAIADIGDTKPTVEAIEAGGGRAIGIRCDVSDERAVDAMVETAVEAFGGLDILVNNAGNSGPDALKPVEGLTAAGWDKVMAVNLRGPFLCARAAIPHLRRRGGGKIINTASAIAFNPGRGFLPYVTSRGGTLSFTRALARELGDDNICVNAIAPGRTETERLIAMQTREPGKLSNDATLAARAIKRTEKPEDLVGALLYLASSASDFVTGQVLVVDGGAVMH